MLNEGKYDGAFYFNRLGEGLKLSVYKRLLQYLKLTEEINELFFSHYESCIIEENNSSAYGFINVLIQENVEVFYKIKNIIREICSDWNKLPSDNVLCIGKYKIFIHFYDEIF